MDCKSVKLLLITANVGSLFEEFGKALKKNWISEFQKLVSLKQPTFIALHLQEVGGKTREVSCKDVENFFESLIELDYFSNEWTVISYADKEYAESKYTALGCAYFIQKSLMQSLELWNFTENSFKSVSEKNTFEYMNMDCPSIRKYKFPLSCFSKHVKRWPRKGFSWTRWKFNNKVFDMLNVHLTHDACNVIAALKSPTKYAKHRRRSLNYLLERINEISSDHQILFGDFNVRPNTKALIEYLMKNKADQHHLKDGEGQPYLVYKGINGSTNDLLKIGIRFFELSNYDAFRHDQIPELIKFDQELGWLLEEQYREIPVTFEPTYPHTEEPDYKGQHSFATVRCPSWCDRILLDKKSYEQQVEGSSECEYDSYGTDVQLGDHKPVYMTFRIQLM